MNQLLAGAPRKTELLLQLFDGATELTIIDTTGEFAPAFADRLAAISNAVYFDPADILHPVGLNVFEHVYDKDTFTEQLSNYIYELFPAGPQTLTRDNSAFLLELIIRVLLEQKHPQTLLSVLKFLKDMSFRKSCLQRIQDPVLLFAWEFFEAFDHKTKQAMYFALVTKIGRLLMPPLVRNIVGQPYTLFSDDVTVVIANLDRRRIGNKNAQLFAALLLVASGGQVVIPDYSFLKLQLPLEQDRFTVGITSLDDFDKPTQKSLLNIGDKYIFSTHEDDAQIFKRYLGLLEPGPIMDLDWNEYRIPGKKYEIEDIHSRQTLRPLKKRTRGCHTSRLSKVERSIQTYLGGP
jgi:hypothetical protein